MIDSKVKEYTERFDEGFPMIPLGWGRTDEEIIKIIDECLQEGKDVYELGYIEEDNEVIY